MIKVIDTREKKVILDEILMKVVYYGLNAKLILDGSYIVELDETDIRKILVECCQIELKSTESGDRK